MSKYDDMTNSELWEISNIGGNLEEAYEVYLHCANDGKGNDQNTRQPLLSFDKWLNN